jgi:hypothetical protein
MPNPAAQTLEEQRAAPTTEEAESRVGLYVSNRDAANQLQLDAGGAFWLRLDRKTIEGSFSTVGNKLVLSIAGRAWASATLQDDKIIDPDGQIWIKQTPFAPIAPPPPDDPPAAPKTISIGYTTAQVIAALGQPERVVKLDSKEICSYKDLKITFVSGKVTDVQ